MSDEVLAPPQIIWRPISGTSQELALDTRAQHTLYTGARGPGKSLILSDKILTFNGWKEAGSININDLLVTPSGKWTRLLGIYPQPKQKQYKFTFDDNCSLTVSADHIWTVCDNKQFNRLGWFLRTTSELLILKGRYGIPYSEAAPGLAWTGLDPYAIGYILANGTTGSKNVTIYSIDDEILDYMKDNHDWTVYRNDNWTCNRAVTKQYNDQLWRNAVCNKTAVDKHVPLGLMTADPASRLALLQGLMDGDGSIEKTGNKCRYTSLSKQLAEDVADLFRSLGGKAHCYKEYRTSPRGGANYRWRVNASSRNRFNPFRVKRKAKRIENVKRVQNIRYINSIEEVEAQESVCFAVADPCHMFVCKNYIVTHNTDTQLMRFRRNVGQGYGSYWRGVIFDREYKNLEDLIIKSKRWFPAFEDGSRFKESAKDLKWTWPTGEELLFRAIRSMEDYWDYHGHEYPFIGWNELTKFPTGELYEAVKSINRSSYTPSKDGWVGGYLPKGATLPVGPNGAVPPPIPLEVFSTANPWGAGHSWVKRKFIDVAPYGRMVVTTVNVFNPATQQREDIQTTQIAIFGTYRENIYLDPKYVADLESIKDKNKRKAWLAGSWDIVAGGAIDDLWNESVHVLPRFEIPSTWRVDRTLDWASTQPFSVGWFAESNGEEVLMPNGQTRIFPAGTIIQISEWYGTEEIGTNIGLKLSAKKIAEGIKKREQVLSGELGFRQWVSSTVWPGPADNQIGNQVDVDEDTIKEKMAAEDVEWLASDKSKGSRVIGLQLLRDRLEASVNNDGPGFYIMDNCKATRAILPTLPRDENNQDDIDTEAEDHIWDMIRYRLLAGVRAFTAKINVALPR